jgi:DNA-binding Lrp family transcriptional regulator
LLDPYEVQILSHLQRNGRASTQDLSDAVGLSPSPCWRRVRRLEQEGYIARYAAVLDGRKLGLNAIAHVQVSLVDYNEATVNRFRTFVQTSDQVLECASITGDFDYLMKVVATDPESLEQFLMQDLLRLGVVRNTTTTFVLRQIKEAGALPVTG